MTDPRTLRALLVAGAAPAGMAQRIERVSEGPEQGIVARARATGPRSSSATRTSRSRSGPPPRASWPTRTPPGATYIDVRLPERPVAGGLPVETIEPVAPAGEVVAPPVTAVPPETAVPPTDPAAAVPPETPVDPAAPAPAPARRNRAGARGDTARDGRSHQPSTVTRAVGPLSTIGREL